MTEEEALRKMAQHENLSMAISLGNGRWRSQPIVAVDIERGKDISILYILKESLHVGNVIRDTVNKINKKSTWLIVDIEAVILARRIIPYLEKSPYPNAKSRIASARKLIQWWYHEHEVWL